MANYRVHTLAGLASGTLLAGLLHWKSLLSWPQSLILVAVAAFGSMLPDVDSDNSKPRQFLFGTLGVALPLLVLLHCKRNFSAEEALLLLLGGYLFIQYPLAWLFSAGTVHRGNFHSLPAALIGAEAAFLLFFDSPPLIRGFFATGCLLGTLSHLLLDELYSGAGAASRLDFHYHAGKALRPGGTAFGYTLLLYGVIVLLAVACVYSVLHR